jgi:hypothetical protein
MDGRGVDQASGSQAKQSLESGICDQEAGGAAHEGELNAFGERITNDAPAAGSECDSDCDFTPSRRRAGEQQVRDIHAGDQKDERHRAKKHQ